MLRGPAEQFRTELRELIDRWKDKPDDDKVTYAEAIGEVHLLDFDLAMESRGLVEQWLGGRR